MPAWQGGCRICHRRRQQGPRGNVRRSEAAASCTQRGNRKNEIIDLFLNVNVLILSQGSWQNFTHLSQTASPHRSSFTARRRLSAGMLKSKGPLCDCAYAWDSARMCDFMCGWMHMCFYKKKSTSYFGLWLTTAHTLLCLVLISHGPMRRRGESVWRTRQRRMKYRWDEEQAEKEEGDIRFAIKGLHSWPNSCLIASICTSAAYLSNVAQNELCNVK